MKRFASTRSLKLAMQPFAGRAQCSVGSIDDDGIRYGLTTHAFSASTISTAPPMVRTQSRTTRTPCGRPGARRPSGSLTDGPPRAAAGFPASGNQAIQGRRVRSYVQRPDAPEDAVARRFAAAGNRSPTRGGPSPNVLLAPACDACVVAGEQDVRHVPAAELRRPRVVRVLEAAAELLAEALV